MMKRTALLFLALSAATAAHGQMTRWVDAEGRIHYSDQPPPPDARSSQTLHIKPGPASPAKPVPEGKSYAEKELEFRKRRVEAEEAAAKQAQEQQAAREKERNCAQARGNLRTLQEGGRISTYNEKGERVFLDDAAREKAIADAQKAVDSWCN
jgi:hypothetical protein